MFCTRHFNISIIFHRNTESLTNNEKTYTNVCTRCVVYHDKTVYYNIAQHQLINKNDTNKRIKGSL